MGDRHLNPLYNSGIKNSSTKYSKDKNANQNDKT